ncbi:surfactin synthase thioesterase subunit [Breoghania corrubedonensis]|uniref:Surfactin synthase thioesterase subunit n=2 Tax=Breoghania corrubedonensis TaxID=665038 RepID=A0A2T5VA68_9HYPH|nr:surfactin synthase thioesterase subunit [Breoghania corrubedonensis]
MNVLSPERTAAAAQEETPWLVFPGKPEPGATPETVRLRLFCFHHAGAAASMFHSWPDQLPAGVEVIAIQLPGREYRFSEPLATNVRQLEKPIADALEPHLDRPYVFFGHSMGILVGFNVARTLRERGRRQPSMIIASGRSSPQFMWTDKGMETLPDEDFVTAVRDYNGTPEELLREEALRELWLPRLRADLTISATYEYVDKPPFTCPILVLHGDDDRLVSNEGLAGWQVHSSEPVHYVRFPGNHFFLLKSEQEVLAELHIILKNHLIHLEKNNDNGKGFLGDPLERT